MGERKPGEDLGLYSVLSRLGFPKSYRGKIMLVAFIGTHVPLLLLTLYFLLLESEIGVWTALRIFALLLVATLLGTALTLYALSSLLAPVRAASSSLRDYLDAGKVPELPISYTDQAGTLMTNVRYVLESLDATIRSLEEHSTTDPLTGTLNRRHAEERLADEVERMRRRGDSDAGVLTVGLVDVDHFKRINDTYGHYAGDVCLRHISEVIGRNIKEGDWLARWGGDEFVLALHDSSRFARPEEVLSRIARELQESAVRLSRDEELRLSVSVGAVRYTGLEEEGSGRDLLARADRAMYEAKRNGRPWVLGV